MFDIRWKVCRRGVFRQSNLNNYIYIYQITTGAYDDLKKAYELAYAMVSKYGMSEKIGYVGYVETDYNKTYSDETNKVKNSINLFR